MKSSYFLKHFCDRYHNIFGRYKWIVPDFLTGAACMKKYFQACLPSSSLFYFLSLFSYSKVLTFNTYF